MRTRSIVTACSVATLLALAVVTAVRPSHGADRLQATRFDMTERAHTVDARVGRGVMRLVVQRTVLNSGPRSDQAFFALDIPEEAVATRLRTSAADAEGRLTWYEGELLEAEEAARRYTELTGIGGAYPKDPALLSWRHRGLLWLQVFPVPARSTKTVEYTLTLPLGYANGAYTVELPPLGTESLPARVRFAPEHPEDVLRVNGVAVSAEAFQASRPLVVELAPRGAPRLDGAIASVPIDATRHLVRARVAAAPRLGEVPAAAHVVVVFDASRSVRSPEAGLAATRAYLSHMRGATVDFLSFDREVRRPIGAAQPVDVALAKLQGLTLETRNGSSVDAALAKADAILRASPAKARRVLLVTDTLTRSRMPASTIGAMPWTSGALVHAARVDHGQDALERDDESPWSALPRRTGGLFWTASSAATVEPGTRLVFEEWARPKRLQKLVVDGLTGGFALSEEELAEGASLDHHAIADAPTTRVQVSGELWSRPITASFAPTPANDRLAAALVFGDPLADTLDEAAQLLLARKGGAVSPVTSYLAIEPGVRPSIDGLEEAGIGMFGTGAGGGGLAAGAGRVSFRGVVFDQAGFLRAELARAAAGCGAAGRRVELRIETTYDEIVDVGDAAIDAALDAKVAGCVREAMWGVTLPSGFDAERTSFDVTTP